MGGDQAIRGGGAPRAATGSGPPPRRPSVARFVAMGPDPRALCSSLVVVIVLAAAGFGLPAPGAERAGEGSRVAAIPVEAAVGDRAGRGAAAVSRHPRRCPMAGTGRRHGRDPVAPAARLGRLGAPVSLGGRRRRRRRAGGLGAGAARPGGVPAGAALAGRRHEPRGRGHRRRIRPGADPPSAPAGDRLRPEPGGQRVRGLTSRR